LDTFRSTFTRQQFTFLPEHSLVRDGNAETYFNMSAIAANIELFDRLNRDVQGRYACIQRVFFGNKLDGVGTTPLANPLEVSLSNFRLGELKPDAALEDTLAFLEHLGLARSDLYARCAPELDLTSALSRVGIDSTRVFVWKNLEPFRIGSQRPSGHYIYLYVQHLHGVIPLGSVNFINYDERWHSDAALYQERLVLVEERAASIYHSSILSNIVEGVRRANILQDRFEQYRFSAIFRAAMFLYADHLRPSSSGPGHSMKRLFRELGYMLRGQLVGETAATPLVAAVTDSAAQQHYNFTIEPNDTQYIWSVISQHSKSIARGLRQITELSAATVMAEHKRLLQEQGLRPEWILAQKNLAPEVVNVFQSLVRQRNSLRNRALSFNPNELVTPQELLREPILI
jgi:alanyl-tRNA synthetase